MIYLLLVLSSLVPSLLGLDCKVGDGWVKDFIKFECYSNARVKVGVRPIGCVPDDRLEGKVIAPGAEYRNEHFFFRCVR
uniref:ZP domain-containing protein n=1 Tax=Steinernema glaseri TaxID=37863 RepID=A0A1I7ZJ39_9BILA